MNARNSRASPRHPGADGRNTIRVGLLVTGNVEDKRRIAGARRLTGASIWWRRWYHP